MGVIYMVRNKINNKCYFGQTAQKGGFDERYRNSFPKNTHNDHIKRAIEKYGWENFEVVKEFDSSNDPKELGRLEDLYIKMWNTTDKKYGYNKRFGSVHGKPNDETREKLSQVQYDENGRHRNDKRVKCLDNGVIYDSVKIASQTLGINSSGIAKCCRGEQSQTNGYHFCFVDEETPMFIPKEEHKQVYCFETDKVYDHYAHASVELGVSPNNIRACCIGVTNQAGSYNVCHVEDKDKKQVKKIFCVTNGKTYNTAKEASIDLGVSPTTITHCCKGRYKQTKGYVFMYIEKEGDSNGNRLANVS